MLAAMFAAVVLADAAPQTAPGEDEARATAAAREAEFQRERFVRAGFPPAPGTRPKTFRRLLLSDPYAMLAVPGVEVARGEDGATTLTIQYPGWSSGPTPLDPRIWDDLMSDEAVFAAPAPTANGERPASACHAWGAAIQSADGLTASWHGCSGGEGPVHDAALQMVRVAMSTRPNCAYDQASPFFAFNSCFQARPELDDPELEAAFKLLREEYDAAPGSDRLLQARRVLGALGDQPDDAAWSQARGAVAGVRAVNDYRRERLQRLIQLDHGAADASAADKAKMRRTIDGWSSFLVAQDRNYMWLLEDLLRKSGRPDA